MKDAFVTWTRAKLPPRRRFVAALAIGVLALAGVASDLQAQPRGRMDPDERERLRRELRQHDERSRGGAGSPRRDDEARDRNRLSTPEREQLRRQLREARPDERRGRGRQ